MSGRFRPAIATMVSRRLNASRGLLAWIVVSEPSWPVFIACNISKRFFAANFADDNAIGPHAQRVDHQLTLIHCAFSFNVGRPRFQPNDVLLVEL